MNKYGGDQTYNVWDIETLQVGDFVNYDAGTWTQEEIDEIKTGSTSAYFVLPTEGTSRNEGVPSYQHLALKDALTGEVMTGWRVFETEEDGSVTLISADGVEWLSASGFTGSDRINYILTDWNWTASEANNYQKRDWSNYINKSQKAENVEVLTKSTLDNWYSKYIELGADTSNNSIFRKIYEEPNIKYQNIIDINKSFWLPSNLGNRCLAFDTFWMGLGSSITGCVGVRLLITLSPQAVFTLTGTKTLTGGNMNTYGGNQTYNVWDIK